MSLAVKLILSLTGPKTIRRFQEQCRHPREAQEKLLLEILRKNKATAFGKKHRFSQIRTVRAFQKQVPLSAYEDLKPYIDAERRGKHGQLTEEKPVLYAMTSGTTGEAKYIPVTPESRRAKSNLMSLWLSAFFNDHPDIFSGRILSVVSPEIEERAPDGTPCGSESGHAYRNVPWLIRSLYSFPYEVFEIEDYESRYYTILRITAAQSLSMIATANPSTILVLCERLAHHTKSIIRDIDRGGLSDRFKVPAKILEKLTPYLVSDPVRAKELRRLAGRQKNKLSPKDVWPNLAGIACWQGGTVKPYLDEIKPYFPENIPIRDLGYLSSEHRGSLPLFDDSDAGVLAVATNFYEFAPAGRDRKPRRTNLLLADELKLGQQYDIFVTTLGGLYRYDMNDIVEVVAYHEETPMIRFVQKEKGMVSFTGEKLSETQVLAAVEQVFQKFHGRYEFISAVGEMNGKRPRYVFLTEFNRAPAEAQLTECARSLDEALCAQNSEYASKRKSLRLEAAVLRVVRRGEFAKYRKRKVSDGSPDGQFKILRLTDDPDFAKEFAIVREAGSKRAGRTKQRQKAATKRPVKH